MSDRLENVILAAIHSRAGSSIVDVPSVLERVDAAERWLLTYEELDSGLQRLSDAGRIAEVDIGRFVSLGSPHATRPYSGLSVQQFDKAVIAYRTAFAADAVAVMRSPLLRGYTSLLRGIHRLTGGRIGLAPEWVDLDAVAITFAVNGVVAPDGAHAGNMVVDGASLIVPIVEGAVAIDRDAVVQRVEEALRQHNLHRDVVVRFSDGHEVVIRS